MDVTHESVVVGRSHLLTSKRGIRVLITSTAVILVGLFLGYLVAANLFLRTHLLRSLINDGPDRTFVEYTSAYSLWPGHVRIRNLLVRDHDASAEWMITLDEARASISLTQLLSRQIHATRLDGTGMVLRIRSLIPRDEVTPARTRFIPPIPGYADPPLQLRSPVDSPPDGTEWRVRLEGVDVVGVREIWVDDFHYNGEADLEGSLDLRPKIQLEVFPTSLDVRAGVLRLRGETLGGSLEGSLEAEVHPCDLRAVKGNAILQYLSGSGRVHGSIENVRFLNDLLATPPRIHLEAGSGPMAAELSLDRGRGRGLLDFSAEGVHVVMPKVTLTGNATGRITLADLNLQEGLATFSGSHVEAHQVVVAERDEVRAWSGRMDLDDGHLTTDPPQSFSSSVSLRASDARPLYALLNIKMPEWAERVLTLEGLEMKARVKLGKSSLKVTSIDARGRSHRISGRYEEQHHVGNGLFLIEASHLALGVEIRAGKTDLKIVAPRKWFESRDDGNRNEIARREGTPKSPRVASLEEKSAGARSVRVAPHTR